MTLPCAVLIAALAAKFAASAWLDILNMRAVRANGGAVPQAFSSFMDERTFERSCAYTIDKTKFGIFESACAAVFLAVVLWLEVLPRLFGFGTEIFGVSVWGQAFALIFVAVALSLPSLPFDLYSQFVIEREYGFNKGTFGLWVADQIKGLLVGVVLGAPILALIIWFSEEFKNTWWLWGFAAVSAFQVAMIVVYPRLILPLFNKLERLPDGDLRDRLMGVAQRGGFLADTIEVMDGSKRSTHSNAFFTGFGRFRRIVLFDTLVEQLEPAEIEAVLAHEIGHYKKGHIVKAMLVNFAAMFATFAFMGWLSSSLWFYEGFGFAQSQGFAPVLIMFSMFSGLFTFWLSPLLNALSRRREYEADAFAAGICPALELKSALRKLHKKNLGNMTPHPLYSAFYYSHPTLIEREAALDKLDADGKEPK